MIKHINSSQSSVAKAIQAGTKGLEGKWQQQNGLTGKFTAKISPQQLAEAPKETAEDLANIVYKWGTPAGNPKLMNDADAAAWRDKAKLSDTSIYKTAINYAFNGAKAEVTKANPAVDKANMKMAKQYGKDVKAAQQAAKTGKLTQPASSNGFVLTAPAMPKVPPYISKTPLVDALKKTWKAMGGGSLPSSAAAAAR